MGLTQKLGTIPLAVFTDSSNNVGIGAAANASYKLQVTGTTNLTGALSGSSATFSGNTILGSGADDGNRLQVNGSAFVKSGNSLYLGNNTNANYWGIQSAGTGATALTFQYNSGASLLSIASTGAATFSSSVGAGISPSSWGSIFKAVQVGNIGAFIAGRTDGYAQIHLGTNAYYDGTNWLYLSTNYASRYYQADGVHYFQSASSGTGGTAISWASQMTITSAGNVGIGTSSPSYKLDISAVGYGIQHYADASNYLRTYCGSTYQIIESNGTNQFGYVGGNFFVQTSATERMRIRSDGNVGIGNAGESASRLYVTGVDSTSSNYTLMVRNSNTNELFFVRNDGALYTGNAGGSPINVTTGSASNTFIDTTQSGRMYRSTASSIRFKNNILDWNESGLDTILALKPKTFTYKEDYYSQPNRMFLGLIAEEVAEVSPYLADYENEDGSGQVENVRYANIVVPLIKAIQELSAKVTALENR